MLDAPEFTPPALTNKDMASIGNKVTEAEIRRWLIEQGYGARAAHFDEVELVAIERPGWVQVFRFQLTARTPDDRRVPLYGAVRDDGRQGATFRVSESAAERDAWLAEWSAGLIAPGARARPTWLVWLVPLALAALIASALLGR